MIQLRTSFELVRLGINFSLFKGPCCILIPNYEIQTISYVYSCNIYIYTHTHTHTHTHVTPRPLFFCYPLNKWLSGAQSSCGCFGNDKNPLPLLGFKPLTVQSVA